MCQIERLTKQTFTHQPTYSSHITKFSVKIVNLETITDMQSWCRTWSPNGSNRIRAKTKLHKKPREACKSSWSPIGSLKSFTLPIPWNSAKLVKIFPGIIVRRHHTDRKQMGLLKEQCAELQKAALLYCRNQVWMKNGGQIPWNAILICEMLRISFLTRKIRMRDFLGNHLTDRLFHLVQKVEYYDCEGPVKNPSVWKESLYALCAE